MLTSLSGDAALQVSCDFFISEVKTFRQLYQFEWLKNHTTKESIIFIQESHSTQDIERLWPQQWLSKENIIFSHGEFNARGAFIGFRENLDYEIKDKIIDQGERYIILKCVIQESPCLLVNLYNPNNEPEQVQTIEKVKLGIDQLDPDHDCNIILRGEFNFIQDPAYGADGGSPTSKLSSIAHTAELNNSKDLVDIWRIRNPFTKRFTFRQKTPFLQRRLDYFLVSHGLQDNIERADITPAVCTDHSAIVIKFSNSGKRRTGSSYWKFNNSLLLDNIYVSGMREQLEVLCNSEFFPDDPRLDWEYLKYKIKEFSREYSIRKKTEHTAVRISLESKLKSLTESLNYNSSNEMFREYEECKNHLENFYQNVANGLIIRSKVDWYEKGEKSNKYFYNLEKRNKAKTHVKSLIDESKNTVTHDQKLIMTKLKSFYRTLYSGKSLMSEKQYMEYLAEINTPVLSSEMKDLCDNHITLNQIFTALNAMSSNKTPGNDGLTKEFYLTFFDILGSKLLKCLNYAFSVGELPTSQRQAVITLIEKSGRDKRLIKNWRPISLLNVDAKIISKILADRVKKISSFLISSDQTAYVLGRYIRESVRVTSDLIEFTDIHNIPGYYLLLFVNY